MRVLYACLLVLGPSYIAMADDAGSELWSNSQLAVSAYGGYNFIDSNSFSSSGLEYDEFGLFGAHSSLLISNGPGYVEMQLDTRYEGTTNDEVSAQDNYDISAGGGAHLFVRNDNGLIGVFGGLTYSDVGVQEIDESLNGYFGLQGQVYFDSGSFLGQVGYLDNFDLGYDFPNSNDAPRESWFVRAMARYFVQDNTKLQLEASYAEGEFTDNQDYDIYGWALEAEHVFGDGSAPLQLAAFARYEGFYANDYGQIGDEKDYSVDTTFKVGLTAYFGGNQQNLYQNDRSGITTNLPDVGRWAGILAGPVE